MKNSSMAKQRWWKAGVLIFALLAVRQGLLAAQPLSKDDITLLLIGGASSSKMVVMVVERGVDFRMTPEITEKFRKRGASKELIEALENASRKLFPVAQAATPAASNATQGAPGRIKSPNPAGEAEASSRHTSSSPIEKKISQVVAEPSPPTEEVVTAAAKQTSSDNPPVAGSPAKSASAPDLSDPSPAQIQNIIHEFATKEKLFKEARDNYTYHQINKVETLDADGNPDGMWEQEWDILYDDQGRRIEHVTYAPPGSLKRVMITEQDLDAMRNIQPFVLTFDELPEYQIKYLGHVKVDYITAYVFSVRPEEIKKGHQYFQGVIWVDDHDLQIVKTEGRQVPQLKTRQGENLFPRFTTWRQQIDGKFWFPTFTMADDTLYFPNGPVHIKEIIRYTNYKQFKSSVRILSVAPESKPNAPPAKPQKPN